MSDKTADNVAPKKSGYTLSRGTYDLLHQAADGSLFSMRGGQVVELVVPDSPDGKTGLCENSRGRLQAATRHA
jgi:hypothetical protein